MQIVISIIISTRNRAKSLRQTLEAIRKIEVPADMPTELILVDNASDDETSTIIRNWRSANMSVRYVRELRRGKSWAHNTGISAARGDALLFTDDDVRPSLQWIESMCRPIMSGVAEIVSGKVRIAPHLERTWMTPMHRNIFSAVEDWGTSFGLVGANMAFTRKALNIVQFFDPELGPGALGFGEEGLYIEQLIRGGFQGIFADDRSVVQHHFDEDRLKRTAFISHAKKTGRSNAYKDYHWKHKKISYPVFRMLKSFIGLIYILLRRPQEIFRMEGIHPAEWHQWYRIAYFYQLYLERKRPFNYTLYGFRKINGIMPY